MSVMITKKILYDLYWKQRKNQYEMAKILKIDRNKLRQKFKEFGIEARNYSNSIIICEFCGKKILPFHYQQNHPKLPLHLHCYKEKNDLFNLQLKKEILNDFYWEVKLTIKKIAYLYGCNTKIIGKYLRKFNIKTRRKINYKSYEYTKLTKYKFDILYYKYNIPLNQIKVLYKLNDYNLRALKYLVGE